MNIYKGVIPASITTKTRTGACSMLISIGDASGDDVLELIDHDVRINFSVSSMEKIIKDYKKMKKEKKNGK